MKVKTKRIICAVLMLLPILYTSALMPFLPDTIPAHFGADGAVDRYGSKLECFILPAFVILFGLFMFFVAWAANKSEDESKTNQSVTLTVTICTLILFNAMQIFFLYTSAKSLVSLASSEIDLCSMEFTILGVSMIVIGNIMPKVRRNSLLGLRTPHSMKNDETWRHSQRFGGYAAIACGLIMTVGCLAFFRGMSAVIFSLVLIMIMAVADCIYAYVASKKY